MVRNRLTTRRTRSCVAVWCALEPRTLLAGFSPTPIEELYLEELNDARFNPAAYGTPLGLDLSNVAPAQPLAMSTLLVESARLHSQDMITNNYFSHYTPQGIGPPQRIAATGFLATATAESIEYNTNSTLLTDPFSASYAAWDTGFSLADLIVDNGTPDLGHRITLLDIGGALHSLRQIGIGIASQDTTDPTGEFDVRQTDTTIDLAATTNTRPFLTGVVFQDSTGNGEYEPGEGLAGVKIAVRGHGAQSTTTLAAGGYSAQLAPGTYTVTASGGGLRAPIKRTVVIGNNNVQLNFDLTPNGATVTARPRVSLTAKLGSFAAFNTGDSASTYSARIDWGNGNASPATLTPYGGGFSVSGSNRYSTAGTYEVRVLIDDLVTGQTMALNGTVVVGGARAKGK